MIAPSVLILGDSIEAGVADHRDVDGSLGIIARTVGPQFGFFNTGQPGESAVSYLSTHTQRLQLSYCTHVFVGFGINDVVASRTKSQIEADLTSIYALCSTKTVFGRTLTPHTSGPWTSTGTQATLAGESVRAALNVDLRSSFHPAGGVADVGAVVETSAVWVPNKTDDGLHPNYSGYTDIATSGAINTALIGTPATPATETGSGWGDHGTKITVSTRRRANDTANPNTAGNPNTTVRGAASNSSGLKYLEIECLAEQTSNFIIGLLTNATANGSAMDNEMGGGSLPDSFGIANGAAYAFVSGTIFTATSVGSMTGLTGAGDVWGMAVDFTNKFAYLSRNGVYFISGAPTSGATGTGHVATWTGTPTLYPGISLYGFTSGVPIQPVRLRTASFLYAPPSGYSAWG
jgi:lysophospholipase L1-like esterase